MCTNDLAILDTINFVLGDVDVLKNTCLINIMFFAFIIYTDYLFYGSYPSGHDIKSVVVKIDRGVTIIISLRCQLLMKLAFSLTFTILKQYLNREFGL